MDSACPKEHATEIFSDSDYSAKIESITLTFGKWQNINFLSSVKVDKIRMKKKENEERKKKKEKVERKKMRVHLAIFKRITEPECAEIARTVIFSRSVQRFEGVILK